jgi:hypothetical protein
LDFTGVWDWLAMMKMNETQCCMHSEGRRRKKEDE